ncbi:hypothetical protein CC2G_006944 [Coprinopsis cinerea AmutBmut pab1-1]|nr:hypothetical protein CC2G_006944 [Coprinopsis cinerea AmutBmut pab1-1]
MTYNVPVLETRGMVRAASLRRSSFVPRGLILGAFSMKEALISKGEALFQTDERGSPSSSRPRLDPGQAPIVLFDCRWGFEFSLRPCLIGRTSSSSWGGVNVVICGFSTSISRILISALIDDLRSSSKISTYFLILFKSLQIPPDHDWYIPLRALRWFPALFHTLSEWWKYGGVTFYFLTNPASAKEISQVRVYG